MDNLHGLNEITYEQVEILVALIGSTARHAGKEAGLHMAMLVNRMVGSNTPVSPDTCQFIDAAITATPAEYALINTHAPKCACSICTVSGTVTDTTTDTASKG
jgi:hypothetical protein